MLCAAPFTVSVLVCSGNDVGMPELRWFACQLVNGSHGIAAMQFGRCPRWRRWLFQLGTVVLTDGLAAPVAVL